MWQAAISQQEVLCAPVAGLTAVTAATTTTTTTTTTTSTSSTFTTTAAYVVCGCTAAAPSPPPFLNRYSVSSHTDTTTTHPPHHHHCQCSNCTKCCCCCWTGFTGVVAPFRRGPKHLLCEQPHRQEEAAAVECQGSDTKPERSLQQTCTVHKGPWQGRPCLLECRSRQKQVWIGSGLDTHIVVPPARLLLPD
jgi:hypothetical protein